mmetsp:Transcript_39849/g.79881  ORF Transcript_39849/g.79881 Transcript_39849/m.79881 type:complete len:140 (+) Transcript_39849:386-805(+)
MDLPGEEQALGVGEDDNERLSTPGCTRFLPIRTGDVGQHERSKSDSKVEGALVAAGERIAGEADGEEREEEGSVSQVESLSRKESSVAPFSPLLLDIRREIKEELDAKDDVEEVDEDLLNRAVNLLREESETSSDCSQC